MQACGCFKTALKTIGMLDGSFAGSLIKRNTNGDSAALTAVALVYRQEAPGIAFPAGHDITNITNVNYYYKITATNYFIKQLFSRGATSFIVTAGRTTASFRSKSGTSATKTDGNVYGAPGLITSIGHMNYQARLAGKKKFLTFWNNSRIMFLIKNIGDTKRFLYDVEERRRQSFAVFAVSVHEYRRNNCIYHKSAFEVNRTEIRKHVHVAINRKLLPTDILRRFAGLSTQVIISSLHHYHITRGSLTISANYTYSHYDYLAGTRVGSLHAGIWLKPRNPAAFHVVSEKLGFTLLNEIYSRIHLASHSECFRRLARSARLVENFETFSIWPFHAAGKPAVKQQSISSRFRVNGASYIGRKMLLTFAVFAALPAQWLIPNFGKNQILIRKAYLLSYRAIENELPRQTRRGIGKTPIINSRQALRYSLSHIIKLQNELGTAVKPDFPALTSAGFLDGSGTANSTLLSINALISKTKTVKKNLYGRTAFSHSSSTLLYILTHSKEFVYRKAFAVRYRENEQLVKYLRPIRLLWVSQRLLRERLSEGESFPPEVKAGSPVRGSKTDTRILFPVYRLKTTRQAINQMTIARVPASRQKAVRLTERIVSNAPMKFLGGEAENTFKRLLIRASARSAGWLFQFGLYNFAKSVTSLPLKSQTDKPHDRIISKCVNFAATVGSVILLRQEVGHENYGNSGKREIIYPDTRVLNRNIRILAHNRKGKITVSRNASSLGVSIHAIGCFSGMQRKAAFVYACVQTRVIQKRAVFGSARYYKAFQPYDSSLRLHVPHFPAPRVSPAQASDLRSTMSTVKLGNRGYMWNMWFRRSFLASHGNSGWQRLTAYVHNTGARCLHTADAVRPLVTRAIVMNILSHSFVRHIRNRSAEFKEVSNETTKNLMHRLRTETKTDGASHSSKSVSKKEYAYEYNSSENAASFQYETPQQAGGFHPAKPDVTIQITNLASELHKLEAKLDKLSETVKTTHEYKTVYEELERRLRSERRRYGL